MNVWGKVFLGLTIVLAAADAYLVTLLYAHRHSWIEKVEKSRSGLAQVEASLRDADKSVREKAAELARIQTAWGGFQQQDGTRVTQLEVQGNVLNAQDGTLAIGAGVTAGIPEPVADKPLPLVYVFTTQADGSSQYVGEFALRDVQAGQTGMQLTQQPPLPTAIAALQQLQGQNLRVRPAIPTASRGLFNDYFARHAVNSQQLDFQRNQLEIQTAQLAKSQAILAQRLAELNGDPQPPEGASAQVVNGLVATIRDEESARDAELQTLEGLRHDLSRKRAQLNGLVQQNQETVSGLPGYEDSLAKPEPRTAAK